MGTTQHSTGIYSADSLESLKKFARQSDPLAIMQRTEPEGANAFFAQLMTTPYDIIGEVRQETAAQDIEQILYDEIPIEIQSDPFYVPWLEDMATICETFCAIEDSDAVGFWLGSQRGCRRYHTDNVPQRLLVTYAGKGTEWLPDDAASRKAYENGEPNDRIVRDNSARQFMNRWDIAIFRGGPNGLLHRTPDAAIHGTSILMRLDHSSFWKKILKQQG